MKFLPPRLLAAVPAAPEGDRWLHEVKGDGYRLLARVERGRVRLFSRPGRHWTGELPGIAAAVAKLAVGSGYFDGGACSDRRRRVPQLRGGAIAGSRGAPRLIYQVFDVLEHQGRDVRSLELGARKALLREVLGGHSGAIRYTERVVGGGPELWGHAHQLGLEGIVSKRLESVYRSGIRASSWLKVKCFHSYRFTVEAVGPDHVLVGSSRGRAGQVPVYSRQRLGGLRPGDRVGVKALAGHPGKALRHAMLVE
jgi:bifunctional non-homologous end joining protein LigD